MPVLEKIKCPPSIFVMVYFLFYFLFFYYRDQNRIKTIFGMKESLSLKYGLDFFFFFVLSLNIKKINKIKLYHILTHNELSPTFFLF